MLKRALYVAGLLMATTLLTAQVGTFARWRIGGGSSGRLLEVDSSGQVLFTLDGTAAAVTDSGYQTFPKVRLAGGATGNLAEVDSGGRLLVSPAAPLLAPTSTMSISDDFPHSGTTNGTVGQLGWVIRNIGAAPTMAPQSGTSGAMGIMRMTTTTTINQGGNLALDATAGILPVTTSLPGIVHLYGRVALTATTEVTARFGVWTAGNTAAQPTNGVWIRYNTGDSDTTFKLCRRAGSDTEACADTGLAADTNYHTWHLYTDAASPTTWYASTDGGSACLTTAASGCGLTGTTFPAVATSPGFLVVTLTTAAASKAIDIDYFGMSVGGLVR